MPPVLVLNVLDGGVDRTEAVLKTSISIWNHVRRVESISIDGVFPSVLLEQGGLAMKPERLRKGTKSPFPQFQLFGQQVGGGGRAVQPERGREHLRTWCGRVHAPRRWQSNAPFCTVQFQPELDISVMQIGLLRAVHLF